MPEDIATLGIQVDSAQVIAGADALQKYASVAKRTGETVEEVQKRFERMNQQRSQERAIAVQQVGATNELVNSYSRVRQANQSLINVFEGANNGALSQRTAFRLLAREASLVGGPLGDLIRQFSILSIGGSRLGFGLTAAVIGIAAAVAAVTKAVTEFAKLEDQLIRNNNLLTLTKDASGQTAKGLEALANTMSQSGTVTINQLREAEVELLKFKEVGASTFAGILQTAKDVAATGFTDFKSAVKALGEAMRDPTKATEALRDAGLSLSVADQRLATDLYNSGKAIEARRLILQKASEQARGADAAAADTLTSAWNRFTSQSGRVLEAIGEQITKYTNLKGILDGLASTFTHFFDRMPQPAKASIGQQNLGGLGQEQLDQINEQNAARSAQEKRIQAVIDALQVEARTVGMNAVEQEIYKKTLDATSEGTEGLNKTTQGLISTLVRQNAATQLFRQTSDSLKEQAASAEIAARAQTMAAGAAAAYTAVETARQQAIIRGTPLNEKQIADLEKLAGKIGGATDAAARERIQFELNLDTMAATGKITEEQAAAVQRLVPLFGHDIPGALKSAQAAQIQYNNTVKQVTDAISTDLTNALVDFTTGTKTAQQAFADFSKALLRDIEQIVVKLLIVQPLVKSLSGVFGSFAPGGTQTTATAAHSGWLVGQAGGVGRYVDPITFLGAPRLHGGLTWDEFPAILQRGETVLPRGVNAGGVTNNFQVIAPPGASVSKREAQNATGGVDIVAIIDMAQAKNMAAAGSQTNKIMRSQFGLSQGLTRR